MKKVLSAVTAALILYGCANSNRAPVVSPETARVDHGYRRTAAPETYTDIAFNGWDIDSAAEKLGIQPHRAHTVMIYMNGSDLESESGAATDDLREIMRARADSSDLNIVLLTGGANRWQIPAIPASDCVISVIKDGEMEKIAGIGQRNMGDAGTLASYIMFCRKYFPADKHSLVLWDHGGGSIAGYGGDENFNNSALSLLEMEYAFHRAGLDGAPLEVLGFDACLMASAEMAVVASRYARFMVASEATEPQDGWNYGVLRKLGRTPGMDGAQLGALIADAYIRSGGLFPVEEMTLSVIDLSEAENVMGAMGELTSRLSDRISASDNSFRMIAGLRSSTKTFGDGSPTGSDTDMVDLLDLAREHESVFPQESADLIAALERAVVYNRFVSSETLGGLSAYYIYGARTDPAQAFEVYRSLSMSEQYTEYLQTFSKLLYSKGMQREPGDTRETTLFGKRIRMTEVAEPAAGTMYAAPATVDGEAADILVFVPEDGSSETVLGYRRSHGYLLQKGYIPFDFSKPLNVVI